MDRSRSELSAVKRVSIDLNLVLHRIRCKLMLRWKLNQMIFMSIANLNQDALLFIRYAHVNGNHRDI